MAALALNIIIEYNHFEARRSDAVLGFLSLSAQCSAGTVTGVTGMDVVPAHARTSLPRFASFEVCSCYIWVIAAGIENEPAAVIAAAWTTSSLRAASLRPARISASGARWQSQTRALCVSG